MPDSGRWCFERGWIDATLGIDVGKADFHCSLLVGGQSRSNSFPKSKVGFERLTTWLQNRKVARVHTCSESTGGWSEELGTYLHERGHAVSIVSPTAIKGFGQSKLYRTKTDKADAALIACYCSAMKPRLWDPPSPSQLRLQRLGRRRAALVEMLVQEDNRLQAPGVDEVRSSIETTIEFLDRQIAEIDTEILKRSTETQRCGPIVSFLNLFLGSVSESRQRCLASCQT